MSEVSENSDKDAEDYQHRLRAMMYKLPGGRNFIDLFAEIQWNEQSARTVTILSAELDRVASDGGLCQNPKTPFI